ncbi:inner membrane protein YiaW [Citrobacter freundii]|nr:inner membrane protein YiaW [Citrobacter freundii]
MFLNYFALGVLIFVFLVIFYGIIILHDIPYLIAKKRNHPHADAIHVAGWVREGANKQVISSQADSLIKISRIWADFFPANTSNQPI